MILFPWSIFQNNEYNEVQWSSANYDPGVYFAHIRFDSGDEAMTKGDGIEMMYFLFIFLSGLYSQSWHNHAELNWHLFETEHFVFHYHDETERSCREAATVAEKIYKPITEFYQFEPDSKTHIILKDTDDYANGAAYYYDNKIEIWALPLDFDLRGSHRCYRM